jgi:hypothetical protein
MSVPLWGGDILGFNHISAGYHISEEFYHILVGFYHILKEFHHISTGFYHILVR